jgi:DNA-binding MarR family transcriptional regulator
MITGNKQLVSREFIMQYMDKHPRLRQWGQLLLMQGENQQPDLARSFLYGIEKFNAFVEASGNTFFDNLPSLGESLFSDGDLFLLSLESGALGLNPESCFEGICCCGPSGSGKTTFASNTLAQLVHMGFSVFALEQKFELGNLISHPVIGSKVQVFNLEDIQLSLFQPIRGVRDDVVLNSTTDLLGKALGKLSAHNLLLDVVRDIRGKNLVGVDEGIPLAVLTNEVRSLRCFSRRMIELKDSLLQGFSVLDSRLGMVLNYRKTNFLEKVSSCPGLYVVECAGLTSELVSFLLSYVCMWLFQYRSNIPKVERLPMMIVADDATTSVTNDSRNTALTDYLLLMRERRLGLMVMSHTFSGLNDLVRQNMGTVVFTGVRSENKFTIRDLIGVNEKQFEQMRVLSKGQAVVFAPSKWPRPLLGNVPFVPLQEASVGVCRESARRFLAGVDCVEWASNPEPEPVVENNPSHLEPLVRQYLVEANSLVPLTVSMLAERCGVSRDSGQRVLVDLENRGLVKTVVVPTGRRGAPYKMVVLSEAGEAEIRNMGLLVPERKLHGGRLHDGVGVALGEVLKRGGCDVRFEVQVGNLRCDVRSNSSSGMTFFQVGVSEVSREVDSVVGLLRDFPDASWKVVVVCLNKEFMEGVNGKLRERLGDGVSRFETVLVGRVLYAYYNNESQF